MDNHLPVQNNNQGKIWDYFQNSSPDCFSGAKPRLDFIIKKISQIKRLSDPCILNIGAGDGYLETTLQKLGWDVYVLDPSQETIKRMAVMNIKGESGYIEKMPFDNEKFDFIVASEVLEHLSDEQRIQGLNEIYRVLRKGGFFLGTVPYCENLEDSRVVCTKCGEIFHRWGHQKSFDLNQLSEELSAVLNIVEMKRTAFVSFKGKPVKAKIKALIKLILAKCGEMIATPCIYFCAKKAI